MFAHKDQFFFVKMTCIDTRKKSIQKKTEFKMKIIAVGEVP